MVFQCWSRVRIGSSQGLLLITLGALFHEQTNTTITVLPPTSISTVAPIFSQLFTSFPLVATLSLFKIRTFFPAFIISQKKFSRRKLLKWGNIKPALQHAKIALIQKIYAQIYDYVAARGQTLETNQSQETEELINELEFDLFAREADKPDDAHDDGWLAFVHPYHRTPFALVCDWQ